MSENDAAISNFSVRFVNYFFIFLFFILLDIVFSRHKIFHMIPTFSDFYNSEGARNFTISDA